MTAFHFDRPVQRAFVYYAVACALTWSLAWPATLSFLRGVAPSPLATAGAGLSAFGPLVAGLVLSLREGTTARMFLVRTKSPWLLWSVLALVFVVALRLFSAALADLLGFDLARWFYHPTLATQVAALIVFPLGEEFGWRGYAYPRLKTRFGLVGASLVTGVMWSLWHLGYMVDMQTGEVDWIRQLHSLVALPLYSVIMTWFLEKARGSVAVALGFHAAAHLNHIELAPLSEVGFQLVHLSVVVVAAWFFGRDLVRSSTD